MFETDSSRQLVVQSLPTSVNVATPVATKQSGVSAQSLDPLNDPRWDRFIARHPRASLFHSSGWLKALNSTYGYPVIAYTTSGAKDELENAIVFCPVESWLTGRRLVSLPFSDHCEPLVDRPDDLQLLLTAAEQQVRRGKWSYFEVRPLSPVDIATSLHVTASCYRFHELDLRPDLETLFANLHKDSTQRKIRRAEREKLEYEQGSGDELLEEFHRVFTLTRRRHHRPPPPKKWFRNLIRCFGEALQIRIARKDGRAIAAMLTLRHKDTLVYKYGGSDVRYNNLGGMHLLYWNSIQEAKACGLQYFDLGRTDADQPGLITFKNRWGACESLLTYSRYSSQKGATHVFELSPSLPWSRLARGFVKHLPNGLLSLVGKTLYKHVG